MPATPRIYSSAQIQRGMADAWWDVAKPASGTHVIPLFTDGSPDAMANPNAKHLGLMDSATMVDYTPKYDEEKADQDTGTVARFLTEEDAVLEVTCKQISFQNVMQYCLPPGFFSQSGPPALEGVTLGQGGNILVTPAPLAIVAPPADPAYKWVVALLYAASPISAVKLPMEKGKTAVYQVQFKGISDLTRPAGDRLGAIYRTN